MTTTQSAVSEAPSEPQAVRPPKISYLPIIFTLLTLAGCGVILMLIQQNTVEIPKRTPKMFVLPEGFSGKVRIYYGIENAEPLPQKDGHWLINIPFNGEVRTSTPMEWGNALDEIFIQQRNEEGGIELSRRNFSAAEIHKTGWLGDEEEFFSSTDELALRDPVFVTLYEENRQRIQAEMTQGVSTIDFPAYELLLIREGL